MAETVALVDCGAGNLHSVGNALKAAGADAVRIVSDADGLRHADRIILPGVGAFGHCMAALQAIPGMIDTLHERVRDGGVPFFGICVGMQLMADSGEEGGVHQGLGWIPGRIVPFSPDDRTVRIPHMGWNDVRAVPNALLVESGEAYYLHGYHFLTDDRADILAASDHGGPFVAAVGRANMIGVQFHPEKSQAYGLALLARFLDWKPR